MKWKLENLPFLCHYDNLMATQFQIRPLYEAMALVSVKTEQRNSSALCKSK